MSHGRILILFNERNIKRMIRFKKNQATKDQRDASGNILDNKNEDETVKTY